MMTKYKAYKMGSQVVIFDVSGKFYAGRGNPIPNDRIVWCGLPATRAMKSKANELSNMNQQHYFVVDEALD